MTLRPPTAAALDTVFADLGAGDPWNLLPRL
jgi:hypothetical protein